MVMELECSIFGTDLEIQLTPSTELQRLHQWRATVTEHATCFYGLNTALDDVASTGGMVVAGRDATGEVRAVERPEHPFFIATLYQPQLNSAPDRPHPVFTGLLEASRCRA